VRIDTPPFKQRTVYAHDVSHREGVCVWPALPVRYVLRSYGVSHRQVGCVCGMQEGGHRVGMRWLGTAAWQPCR
jgi:hypothetical protein